jgi:fatty acid desaturase
MWGEDSVLTISSLGMLVYGVYSAAWAVADLVRGAHLELWAELGLMAFGALLALAAAFVRVRLPGGLAFAIGAMLGLQALGVHDAVHLGGGVAPQIVRGAIALVLVALALSEPRPSPARRGPGPDRTTT